MSWSSFLIFGDGEVLEAWEDCESEEEAIEGAYEAVSIMYQGAGYLREAGEDEDDIDDSDPVSIRLIEYDDNNNEVQTYEVDY